MKKMDARLDEKVAAMDAAKGDQKLEAMAASHKGNGVPEKDYAGTHDEDARNEKRGHTGT
ncbi:MAG: hypothetical protein ABSF90_26095 [Syntrophobacteraceae bacterium]|jgi:hypothetical protein